MSRTVESILGIILGTALIAAGLTLTSWWFIAAGVTGLAIAAVTATEEPHAD